MIRVRDAVRRCLRSQLDGTPDEDVVTARQQLNQTYDSFTARFGPLSERGNTSAFRGDPDLPLLLSLEHYDEESGRATKAAIFRERTIQRKQPIAKADTPPEALLVTLNERGCVDLDYLAQLLHRRPSEFLPELKGAIFLNPQSNRWETEDDYLSGNVRAKLAVAEAAALVDEQFTGNVEALKAVQPGDLSAMEIDARLGSTWIPAEDVQLFATQVLNEEGVTVSHAPQLGLWVVRGGLRCLDRAPALNLTAPPTFTAKHFPFAHLHAQTYEIESGDYSWLVARDCFQKPLSNVASTSRCTTLYGT